MTDETTVHKGQGVGISEHLVDMALEAQETHMDDKRKDLVDFISGKQIESLNFGDDDAGFDIEFSDGTIVALSGEGIGAGVEWELYEPAEEACDCDGDCECEPFADHD